MHYVRQGDPRGLGHAVLCAAQHVGAEPFAVLLGDDMIHPERRACCRRMIEVRQQQFGGSVIALMEVPQPTRCPAMAAPPSCRSPTRTTDDVVLDHRPGREARSRGRAEQSGDHRSLCAGTGGLRRAATHPARPGRGDPAHRRASAPGQDRPGGGRRRCTACCSAAATTTTPATGSTTCAPWSIPQFACEHPDVAREFRAVKLHDYLRERPGMSTGGRAGLVPVEAHVWRRSLDTVDAARSSRITVPVEAAEGCVLAEDVVSHAPRLPEAVRATPAAGRLRRQGRGRRRGDGGFAGHAPRGGRDRGRQHRALPGWPTGTRVAHHDRRACCHDGADAVVPVELLTDGVVAGHGVQPARSPAGERTPADRGE